MLILLMNIMRGDGHSTCLPTFFSQMHILLDVYAPGRTCVQHLELNSKLFYRVTASAHVVCIRKFIFGSASHVKGHRSC